jgi:hypothetical protein
MYAIVSGSAVIGIYPNRGTIVEFLCKLIRGEDRRGNSNPPEWLSYRAARYFLFKGQFTKIVQDTITEKDIIDYYKLGVSDFDKQIGPDRKCFRSKNLKKPKELGINRYSLLYGVYEKGWEDKYYDVNNKTGFVYFS